MIDVLIIGTGGAGLTAGLTAKDLGASVLVVGKAYPTNSQTSMAQGGMNAALGNVEEDSIESHIADTVKSARGLCDEKMIELMCSSAPSAITWLESIGVPFSRLDNSKAGIDTVAQRQMGGASAKRACYAQDYTGLKILHTLYDTCLKHKVDFLDEHYLMSLIIDRGLTPDDLSQSDESSAGLTPNQTPNQVKGATFLDIRTGEMKQINAKSVIVATGGYGGIYHNYTTNMTGASGDGIAAVLRAGGAVSDMEFIQFHPTALKSSSILISESARGEGGYLVNTDGERFIDELKPRDVVARAIYEQFQAGQEVFLDIRHLGEEKLMQLLPQEVALCKLHENIDPATERIPIKPVAHYSMGGIDVNHTMEIAGIQGCFAVGECSNAKVHGVNRLGGNSLLEITAFGKVAGESAYKYASTAKVKEADKTQQMQDKQYIENLYTQESSLNFYTQREKLGKLFYENVGIVRNNKDLNLALGEIVTMQENLTRMSIEDKSPTNNTNLIDFLEFANTILLSSTIVSAAIARDESRGAHYKEEFKEQDDEKFKNHIVFQWSRQNT